MQRLKFLARQLQVRLQLAAGRSFCFRWTHCKVQSLWSTYEEQSTHTQTRTRRSASGPGSSLQLLLLLKLFYCKHCLSLLVSSWSAKSPHPLFAEESWLPVLKLQGLTQTDKQNIVGKIHKMLW